MSRKKQVYEKITALYCRISLDDGGDNESMSISCLLYTSKQLKSPNNMRGKASPIPPNRKARRKRK